MKITIPSGVFLALNVVCAATNVMIAPQVFGMGFAVGAIAGLGHSIYIRTQIGGQSDNEILKKVKKLNPFPGPLATFVAYVAMKVNEYGIIHLPFYSISLLAGVPLGYTTGKMIGLIPWSNDSYKAALAKVAY